MSLSSDEWPIRPDRCCTYALHSADKKGLPEITEPVTLPAKSLQNFAHYRSSHCQWIRKWVRVMISPNRWALLAGFEVPADVGRPSRDERQEAQQSYDCNNRTGVPYGLR